MSLVLAVLAAACGGAGGGAAVSWDDPSGDVTRFANLPDLPLPDVTRVSVNASASELIVVFRTADPVSRVLDYTAPDGKKRGATVANVFLDTDNDPATGGAPFSRNTQGLAARKGYDRQISVQLGFLYEGAEGTSGMSSGDVALNTSEVRITAPTANYYVYALTPDRQYGGENVGPESLGLTKPFREMTRLGEDTIEIRVPYAALGIKAGASVRLCVHDTQQSSAPDLESVSEDRTLRVE